MKSLSVLGSVLYVGAHPDDENTNLLAYFTKGRMMRTGYLSLTRGEGGQNLIGPEKGDALGLIRTQELLAARSIDGAEQFFSRAIDFGYSKNSDEAIRLWGGDEIVADIVRVIRTFQPDIIITRFSAEGGGHGQHTASAILTRRAFELAADPAYQPWRKSTDVPGTEWDLPPWKAKRLLFNRSSFMRSQMDTSRGLKINTGGYHPLLGLSYNEISGISRSMHKSQGFGAAQTRGDVINYFFHTAGDSAASEIFEGIGTSWSRVPGGEAVSEIIASAVRSFDLSDPSASVPMLARAVSELDRMTPSVWTRTKRRDLLNLIQAAAGLWIDALVSEHSATPGDTISVRASVMNRSDLAIELKSLRLPFTAADSVLNRRLPNNYKDLSLVRCVVPRDERAGVPYWLEIPSAGFRYEIHDPTLVGLPERPPVHTARFTLDISGEDISFVVPLRYSWVDPVEGELTRPFVVVGPVSVEPVEGVVLYSSSAPKTLDVWVRAGRAGVSGVLRVETPSGWTASPASARFVFNDKGQTTKTTFTIAASRDAAAGEYRVIADVNGEEVNTGILEIRYPHIPAQTLVPQARGKLIPALLQKKKFFIGYITGSGDEVPEALRQMGYDVRALSDEDLLTADLSGFQTIVAGVRAYNTRSILHTARQRLMDYVSNGGTYVVQYITTGETVTDSIGPYPFQLSRDRVSEEDAAVTILNVDHPALVYPNRITQEDFSGWVQERGLYFADGWDSSYVPILSAHDGEEPERRGGLIIARHGEGYFCYTGLSFFRQLPAGVAGAYRFFANLVELGSFEKLKQ